MAKDFVSLIASKFGLSEDEAKVYGLFILYRILTLGEICYHTALPTSKVESILQSLKDKGLISHVPGVIERYVAVTPFKALSEVVGDFISTAEEADAEIRKHFEDSKADLKKAVDSFKSNLKDSVMSELQTLKGEVNKASELLEKLVQREKVDLSDMIKRAESYSLGQLESYRRLSEESLTLVKREIENESKSVLEEVRRVTGQSAERASNTLTSMRDGANIMLGEIEKKVIKDFSKIAETTALMASKIAEKVMEAKSEYDSKVRETVEAAMGTTSKTINPLKKELDERASLIKRTMSETIQKGIERRKEQANKLEKMLNTSLRNSTSEIAKNISSFYTSALRPLWSLSREHEKWIQNISERTSKLVDASISRLSSMIDETKTKIAERIKAQFEIQEEVLRGFGSRAREHVTSTLKEFEAASSSIRERFSSVITENTKATNDMFDRTRKAVESLVSEHAETMRNILKKVEEEVQASLVTEKEAEEKEFSKFKDAFSSMLEFSKRELTEAAGLMSENALKEIYTRTTEFINELKRLKEKVSETIEKELKMVRWEAEEARESIEKFLVQRITDMEEYVERVKQWLESMIKERMEELSVSAETVQVGFAESMNRILDRVKEIVEDAKNGFSVSLATQLSSFKESLDRLGVSFTDELSRQMDVTKAEANEILSKFSEELEHRVSEVETLARQIMENAEAMFKRQEKISRQLRDVVSTFLVQEAKQYIDSFSNILISLNERLVSLIESKMRSLEKLRNNLEKELHSFIVSEGVAIEEKNVSLRETVNSYVSERYKEYVESLEVVAKEVEELLREHMEYYRENLEGLIGGLSDALEETLEKISRASNAVINDAATQLDTEKEAITGEAKILIETASKMLDFYVKKLRSSITASLNDLLKEVSRRIESLREGRERIESLVREAIEADVKEFEEALKNLEGALALNLNNEKERTLSSVVQLELKLQDLLNKVREELDAYSGGIQEESKGILDNYSKEVIGLLDASGKEINSYLEESRKIFGAKTDEVKGMINGLMEELSKELDEIIHRTREGIAMLVKGYHEKIERNIEETRARLISELKTCIEKEERDVTNFSQNVVETLFRLMESCGKTLEGLNNNVASYLSEFHEKAAEHLDGTMENISEKVRVLLEELKAVKLLSQSAWGELARAPLSIEKTCFIATGEVVKTRIREMVKRTKNSLIVVAPELGELPVEELLGIEPPAKLYVFADFNLPSELNVLKSLISKRNLRFWRRKEKEFFMCLRDDEEILIAPVSKETPILAIVSEERSYIDAYKRTLIPFLRSTAEEVKLKDIDSV